VGGSSDGGTQLKKRNIPAAKTIIPTATKMARTKPAISTELRVRTKVVAPGDADLPQ
jgi:hypothetical protein